MAGTLVRCTKLDDVRIDLLSCAYAITIPASFILAVYRVLEHCQSHSLSLEIDLVSEDSTSPAGWQATLDMGQDLIGPPALSPWRALQNLADEIP
jgi:hypothetical protein